MVRGAEVVSVSGEEYLYFVRRAIDGMRAVLAELGDGDACRRPNLPGANTPYGLLTHCLGVMEYWGGYIVAGREVHRDRAAEFDAVGTVAELDARACGALARLERDLVGVQPTDPPRNQPHLWALGPGRPLTQGTALLHLYEELAQHHGQLEVLRDALRTAPSPDAVPVTGHGSARSEDGPAR